MNTPNREQIYRWIKVSKWPALAVDLHWRNSNTKQKLFGELVFNANTLFCGNRGMRQTLRISEVEYLEELPQSIPLTKEVKETVEQVYDRVTMQHLGNKPNGTRMDIVYESMRQYAQESRTDLLMENIELKERIKELEKVPVSGWISINERLPTCDDLTNGAVWAWSTRTESAGKVNHMYIKTGSQFSHWMPLPKKP